ncbi:MAG: restriction endonuclease subunit S [Acidobacteriaceae bacterium]
MAPPAGWSAVSLCEVATRITGRNVTGNENVLTISARDGLISQEEFFHKRVASSDTRQYFLLHPGDFVYSKSYSEGHPVGVIRRLRGAEDGVVSPLYICFRPDLRIVDERFIEYYLTSGVVDDQIAWIAKEGSRNHGLLNVGVDDFMSIPISLPPIEEQRRIAEILEALDHQLGVSKGVIEKGETVRKVILGNLLEEQHWEVCALGEVATISSGSTPLRSRSDYWHSGSVPWVKTGEVNFLTIASTQESITPMAIRETGMRIYPVGAVIVAMYGEGATRGRSAILGIPAAVNQACAAIICHADRLDPEYLLEYLRHKYCDIRAIGHGSNQTNLNSALLSMLPIAVPPPRRQERIVSCAKDIDERLTAESLQLSKYIMFKQGLMNDLLTGQVRVTAGGVEHVGTG